MTAFANFLYEVVETSGESTLAVREELKERRPRRACRARR